MAIELSGYHDSLFDKEFLSREDFQRTCTEATQRVAKKQFKIPYEAIVVDEAQDLVIPCGSRSSRCCLPSAASA